MKDLERFFIRLCVFSNEKNSCIFTHMKIIISGSTGFLGSKAANMFSSGGHEVVGAGRELFSLDAEALAKELQGAGAIIHLAGAPILRRWTKKWQREIYESRVKTTRRLTDAMHFMEQKPRVFICASAVGIYPDTGVHDERSDAVAGGFLGKVCRDWEAAAARAPEGCRTLMFRFGIILGSDGGALKQMLLPFRLGLGGRIAGGRQKMSWVHIDDVLGAMLFALEDQQLTGPVNICSPGPVTNADFTRVLARTLRRPAMLPIPSFILRLAFGKGAGVLTGGQCALPAKLEASRYRFRFPGLEDALKDLLKH